MLIKKEKRNGNANHAREPCMGMNLEVHDTLKVTQKRNIKLSYIGILTLWNVVKAQTDASAPIWVNDKKYDALKIMDNFYMACFPTE